MSNTVETDKPVTEVASHMENTQPEATEAIQRTESENTPVATAAAVLDPKQEQLQAQAKRNPFCA